MFFSWEFDQTHPAPPIDSGDLVVEIVMDGYLVGPYLRST